MNRGVLFLGIVIIGIIVFFIERYFFNGLQKSLILSYQLTFFLYLIISFLILLFFKKIPPPSLIFSLVLPQALIGLYALIFIPFRVPDVYPISTVVVILGCFAGFLVYQKKTFHTLLIIAGSIFIGYFYYHKVSIPALFVRSVIEKGKNNILADGISNLKNDKLNIIDASKVSNKTVFMEFWFKNCEPCKLKMKSLQALYQFYKNDTTKVFCTVNVGSIDDFITFKTEIQKKEFHGFENYYDSAGIFSKKLRLSGLPAEIIFRKNTVIRKMSGWEQDMSDIYLRETIKLLNQ